MRIVAIYYSKISCYIETIILCMQLLLPYNETIVSNNPIRLFDALPGKQHRLLDVHL